MTNPARRRWLAWAARGVYGACAAAVAWPSAKFFAAPLAAPPAGPVVDRAVKLSDLRPGVPKLVAVRGGRTDAWTRYEDQVVGRAWVVRLSGEETPIEEVELNVFSSVCPHAGCQVSGTVPADELGDAAPAGGLAADAGGLLCPCHGARFAATGEPLPTAAGGPNPSPRGLDPLDYTLAEGDDGTVWVEVEYRRFAPGVADRAEV